MNAEVVKATTDPDKKNMQERLFEKLKTAINNIEAAIKTGTEKEIASLKIKYSLSFLSTGRKSTTKIWKLSMCSQQTAPPELASMFLWLPSAGGGG